MCADSTRRPAPVFLRFIETKTSSRSRPKYCRASCGWSCDSDISKVCSDYRPPPGSLQEGLGEEVKARLNELPPERRVKIQVAAGLGGCKSLETLEQDLLQLVASPDIRVHAFESFDMTRLSDDRCDLGDRSERSPCWVRHYHDCGTTLIP
jgi:hypothetical protein